MTLVGTGFEDYYNTYSQLHMRIHTKDKQYKCDTCGIWFKDCDSLLVRMYTHTKDKPCTSDMYVMWFNDCVIHQDLMRSCLDLKEHIHTHTCEKPCNIST